MKIFILTIALVFLSGTPGRTQETGEPSSAAAPAAKEEAAPDAGMTAGEAPVEGFVYDSKDERDPFLRLVDEHGVIYSYDQETVAASNLVLEGILAGGGENLAIINGEIMTVGSVMGAYTVEGISADTVILRKGQDEVSLTLNKEE